MCIFVTDIFNTTEIYRPLCQIYSELQAFFENLAFFENFVLGGFCTLEDFVSLLLWEAIVPRGFCVFIIVGGFCTGRQLCREDFKQEDFVPGGFCTWEDFVSAGKCAASLGSLNQLTHTGHIV